MCLGVGWKWFVDYHKERDLLLFSSQVIDRGGVCKWSSERFAGRFAAAAPFTYALRICSYARARVRIRVIIEMPEHRQFLSRAPEPARGVVSREGKRRDVRWGEVEVRIEAGVTHARSQRGICT